MAAECFFCKRSEGPFVLVSKTATVCRACAQLIGAEAGLASPPSPATDSRERWERELVLARLRALRRQPYGTCSFCGTDIRSVVVRRRVSDSEPGSWPEPSAYICRTCVERAVAATKTN